MSGLALTGGTPVRTRPWPRWPAWGEEEEARLLDVLHSGVWGGYSPQVAEFEQAFAATVGTKHCVSMANGTVTLVAALRALGVRPGIEVIVPTYTFFSTASAVVLAGGTPVFADMEPDTWNMDLSHAESLVTSDTLVIVPVHFAGLPVDLDRLLPMAERHGLKVLEDAAHAVGSTWRGRQAGTFGAIASFSFQAAKNVTAGEGGALVTDDDALCERVWSIGNLGRRRGGDWYLHDEPAANYRMTGWSAAVLNAQLARLNDQVEARMAAGAYLREQLDGSGLVPATWDARAERHAHHLLPLRYLPEEFGGLSVQEFARALAAEGVPVSLGYPMPLNRQPAFGGRLGECPIADAVCASSLWLSQYILLAGRTDLDDIVEAVHKVRTNDSSHLPTPTRS